MDLLKMEDADRAAKLSKMSDEQLQAAADDLAEKRTQVRLAQVAVSREQSVREATKNLDPETRRIVKLGLAGGIGLEGSTATKEADQ